MSTNLSSLAKTLRGELLTQAGERELYATDASMYYLLPEAILCPQDERDVVAAIQWAAKNGLNLTARGAGTSTAGQAIGRGLILDFSRHMNQILELNEAEKWIRVQPGIVYAQFNECLKPHGLFFPVNPSSGRMCTLGGMLANNASGPYSLKYGATKSHVLGLRVALANGTVIDTESPPADLARRLTDLLKNNRELIETHTPRVAVNSSGYNLHSALADGKMDFTQIFIGSEGTLGVILSAKLRLTSIPQSSQTAILGFENLEDCGEAVNRLRQLHPSALEILDDELLSAIRESAVKYQQMFPESLETVLFLQFDSNPHSSGQPPCSVPEGMERAQAVTRGLATEFLPMANEEEGWKIRKSASPLLHRLSGGMKPLKFIEDAAVPPERLKEYLRGLKTILQTHGVKGAAFGHAGNGHIHINPRLNPRLPADRQKLRLILDAQTHLVLGLGGTLSGEHGDGILRSGGLARQYGPLVAVFRELKNVLDPQGILNPGKILNDNPQAPFQDWRYDLPMDRFALKNLEHGAFLEFLDACHGCGQCRDYCPVFRERNQEIASGRAKAHVVRGLLAGHLQPSDATLREALTLCGECRLCLQHCPTQIDIAKLCAESQLRICPS